jgi:hypothetical protein
MSNKTPASNLNTFSVAIDNGPSNNFYYATGHVFRELLNLTGTDENLEAHIQQLEFRLNPTISKGQYTLHSPEVNGRVFIVTGIVNRTYLTRIFQLDIKNHLNNYIEGDYYIEADEVQGGTGGVKLQGDFTITYP